MRRTFYIAGKLFPLSLERLQRMTGRYVICPFYHAVSDTPLAHIAPLYRHRTAEEFKADMAWLCTHFTPIHWYEIDAYERAQKPAFCLTFDDGLKEFYTLVAPVLELMKVPCVCFLNSAFVDNKDLMFRYKEALQSQGVDWQEFLRTEQPYMTYDQIRDLQRRGFDFGSHSINHPHFESLSIEEQLDQTLGCENALREHIRLQHRLFSFPFGHGNLNPLSIKVHKGSQEAVFGTGNLRPAGGNMYNRISMDGSAMSAKDIVRGEYLREIAHQRIHD